MLKYHAFISYSHKDRKWAQWLHRSLESYRVPSDLRKQARERAVSGSGPLSTAYPVGLPVRLRPIFRDRDELPTAADLGVTIRQALEHSHALIVLCSPAAAASKYVDAEIRSFREMDRDARIFALIVEGDPPACFPPALTEDGAEPIAADARPDGDGKNNARVKLIAGLLGLEYDRLKRRLEARERAETWLAMGVVLTVAIVMMMLAAWAFQERTEAVVARLKAEDAKKQAERSAASEKQARASAEKLINETIFDLRDKLQPVGRLDLLDGISLAAESYFETLPVEQRSVESEHRESVMCRNRGDVLKQLGKLADAGKMYEKAHHISSKLTHTDAGNLSWQEDHVILLMKMGDAAMEQGDQARALRCQMEASTTARSIAANYPSNDKWQISLAQALGGLGMIAIAQGRHDDAAIALSESRTILERLSIRDPGNTQWKLELTKALENMARLATAQNNLTDARRHLSESASFLNELAARDPFNTEFQRSLYLVLYSLGKLMLDQNDYTEAVRHLSEGQIICQNLAQKDPLNISLQSSLFHFSRALGLASLGQNDASQAVKHISGSVSIIERLAERDYGNRRWQSERSLSFALLGLLKASQGAWDEAMENLHRARLLSEELVRTNAGVADWQFNLASIYANLAACEKDRGRLEEAAKWKGRSLSILSKLKQHSQPSPQLEQLEKTLNQMPVKPGN